MIQKVLHMDISLNAPPLRLYYLTSEMAKFLLKSKNSNKDMLNLIRKYLEHLKGKLIFEIPEHK